MFLYVPHKVSTALSSSSPRGSVWPCLQCGSTFIGSVSDSSLCNSFSCILLPRPDSTFLEIDAPTLGVPHYDPLILRLHHRVPNNMGLLLNCVRTSCTDYAKAWSHHPFGWNGMQGEQMHIFGTFNCLWFHYAWQGAVRVWRRLNQKVFQHCHYCKRTLLDMQQKFHK